jgi:hypothetical protein
LVFWSDKAYASRHSKEGWSEYVPTSIELDEFINIWLPRIYIENDLVGPNWDAALFGLEVEPRDVAQQLVGKILT